MNKNHFTDLLSCADFKSLFNEMGWDHPAVREDILLTLDEQEWVIREVAQKCGFHAYVCETTDLPQHALHRKLDVQLRRYGNDYLIVFVKSGEPFRHQWMVPVKTVEKRELVIVEYEKADQTAFLFEKTEAVSFGLTEQVSIVDVTARVHSVFTVNAARITKDFYTGFRKQHEAFAKFIEGIPESSAADRPWFASVMLNRLMFCYFIQKKKFLNLDLDYLQNKLRETQERRGRDAFFGSFYKEFLRVLFRDGLNAPRHDAAFEKTFGRIPYLNGGLFEQHAIEKDCPGLDIPDRAFEDLFAFFDKWHWHLDTRMTASGHDINPDVLGYIFEQYINDRAQMGAYYTKEDITGYIAKNCIVPFLFDAVSRTDSARHFKPGGFVWRLMKTSGDAYIYPAVKKGVDLPLPPEIERGVSVASAPGDPPLRERRAAWNTPADARYALPTEIWRETVARRQRCLELRREIAAGEIASVSDLVTGNLDIRRFTEDVLEKTDDHLLIRHFYDALRAITVLDPTCGSGAFLFAALNVLEPLYEICIARMQEFHERNKNLFKDELSEIENKYRSNIQHYIYKSIILRNLYGVDIMREATEIAKLRLFLKMVAVVDVDKRAENLGLDPLPDIDFNIRCGNTLVGFASKTHIQESLATEDLFSKAEFEQKIDDELEKVSVADRRFKDIQLNERENALSIKTAKDELSKRLEALNKLLNKTLYGTANPRNYDDWLAKTQPFNWIAEFHQIIHEQKGFDVIIGNPPYVVNTPEKVHYRIQDNLFATYATKNLHAYVFERAVQLGRINSAVGMIVQLTALSAEKMKPLQDLLFNRGQLVMASFPRRPESIFDGVEMPVTILISRPSSRPARYTTRVCRFYTEERINALHTIKFACHDIRLHDHRIAKIGSPLEVDLYQKMNVATGVLGSLTTSASAYVLYYQEACRYWAKSCVGMPFFQRNDEHMDPPHGRTLNFNDANSCAFAGCLVNSTLFYWFYSAFSDCEHVNDALIRDFNLPSVKDTSWIALEEKLSKSQKQFAIRKTILTKQGHKIDYDEMNAPKSKSIIDEIDTLLAKHYGFTDEELDFIVNYDIKYRMGDALSVEESI